MVLSPLTAGASKRAAVVAGGEVVEADSNNTTIGAGDTTTGQIDLTRHMAVGCHGHHHSYESCRSKSHLRGGGF